MHTFCFLLAIPIGKIMLFEINIFSFRTQLQHLGFQRPFPLISKDLHCQALLEVFFFVLSAATTLRRFHHVIFPPVTGFQLEAQAKYGLGV
jgi:hypothetical protein